MVETTARGPDQTAELLEAAFAAMGRGVLVYGPGGELLRMNAAAEQILGVSKARWLAAGGPEGRAALVQLRTAGAAPLPFEETPLWKALHGQSTQNVELRLCTPGGEPRWVSAAAAPLLGPAGERLGAVVTFSDVTEPAGAVRALADSEQMLRVSFANAAIGFAMTTPDGHFLDANPAYCTITGYALEELRATTFSQLVHPGDRAANMRQIERMLAGELSDFVVENRYLRKDGEVVWVRKSVSVVRSEAGAARWIVALVEDVTERRRAEQALREAHQRMGAHLDNSPLAVIEFDPGFRVTRWSRQAERLFGWTAEEIVGRAISELRWVHEDDAEGVARESAGLLTGARTRSLNVNRNYRKDGSIIHCEWYSSAIHDADGRLLSVLSQVLDVTERLRAEEALSASESTLRGILNATSESVWLFSADGVALAGNRTALARMDRPPEGIIGRSLLEFLPEELARSRLARLQEVASTGRPLEFEDVRAGRSFVHSFYPVSGADGRVDRVASFSRDITEGKRAQEALRRYQLVANHSRDVILLLRRDGRILEANLAAAATYGYTREELNGLSIVDLRAAEASGPTAEQMAHADADGILFETIHRRKDGSTFPVEVSSQGADIGGERTLVSVIRDITQRRQAEDSLRAASAQLAAERDRLAVTLGSIGDAVISTDGAARVELFNGVAEQLTGWRAEEARGRPIHEVFNIIDEESGRPAVSPVGRVLAEGVTLGLANHTALVARDGTARPVADSAAPIRDPHGRVTGVVLVFRDQTDERLAQRALRESEARLRLLAEALPQLVWTADETGRVDFFNQRWRDYTGQAVEAEDWEPALHPEDRERVVALWSDAIARQREFEIEHRLRRADGEFRWFLRRATLLSHPDGVSGRWFGTCTDIHDLRTSQDLLRQADRLKDDFLSMASHEFRTPLTALRLQVELMTRRFRKAAVPDERLERQLKLVESQIGRLEGLLGTLLDVSRINAGRFTLDLSDLDLAALTLEVVERFRPEAEAASTDLRVSLRRVQGSWDRMRLDQVVTNLVSNAIKYGNRQPVEVEVGDQDGSAVLIVRDHGIGIEPGSLARVFERFERGGNVGNLQGLGLGLWIARKMVEAHGGGISVASAPGAGTTFTVSLPRSPSAQAPGT